MLNASIILSKEDEQQVCSAISQISGIKWNSLFFSNKKISDGLFCGIPIVSSPETLQYLNDLIFVLDKSFCNYDFLSNSIRNGCHLFIQEASDLTERELKQLSILASEGGTVIQVRNDLLNQPLIEKSLDLFCSSQFLEIRQFSDDTRISAKDLLYKNLSLLSKFKDFPVSKMDVAGTAGNSGNRDVLNLRLEFTNGSVITLTVSTICIKPQHSFTFFGNEITAIADFISNSFVSKKHGEEKIDLLDSKECLIKQIEYFANNISTKSTLSFSLEEELGIHQLMQNVTEKLKLRSVTS
jgi:hypothetical protein